MSVMNKALLACVVLLAGSAVQNVDFAAAKLRPVNRQISRLQDRGGIHVSAVLAKLGVTTRREAARRARELRDG